VSAEGIRRLDRVLSDALSAAPFAAGLREQSVLQCWSEIVGETIAAHSEAVALSSGTLFIAVDSSVWAQELSLLRGNIAAAIDARLGPGHVRELRFQNRSKQFQRTTLPDGRG
jgi:predicted nucleic acid-binding Zn ribbon protein